MSDKKLLLFDFDGTIADTLQPIVNIINEQGSKYGIVHIDKKELGRLRGMTPREVIAESKVPFYKLPFLLGKIRFELLKHMDEMTIFNGMKNALTSLKKEGYTLAIATSSPKENVVKFLDAQGLTMFDDIYSNKNVFGKARTLKSILRQRQLQPQEAIYIGDEVRDILACRESGIFIIAVTWGFNTKKLLIQYQANAIVDSPEELVKVIRKLS